MEAVSRAVFIRHAETGMAGRYCGHSDPDLSAQGRAQVTELVRQLSTEPFDAIYTSDLRRASSTAQAIAAARNIPWVLRPALREIHFGDWESMSWEEIEQLDPDYARKWLAAYPDLPAPRGESFQAFEARILEEVHHLLGCNYGSIAVVTHGGVLRVVLRRLLGRSDQAAWEETRPYCCMVRYEGREGGNG
jgi:broad specificity phosphatase PhoE